MTSIGVAAAGAWLWGKFGDKVIERAGKLAGASAGKAWSTFTWEAAAERYRGEMQMRYGMMRIIGMTEPVALADIFTDLYLLDKPSAWRRDTIEELQLQLQLEPESLHRRAERRKALMVVKRHERLMILGKPGAGKTTLLKHLVLECTNSTSSIDAVPIFVGLKVWADSGLTLTEFLERQFAICAFPKAEPFIDHILQEGKALVLFDGLDEVNVEQGARRKITQEIVEFVDKYSRSRCVMTCRTAASEYQFERFVYCELADFTIEQMQTFVTQWFQHSAKKRDSFLTEFAKAEHNRFRDLARTPLLLALLCIAFDDMMRFPIRRSEIYKDAIDALLKKWDASQDIKRDAIYRALSPEQRHQMLNRIANDTFRDNQLFISQEVLVGRIVRYVQNLPPGDTHEEIDGHALLTAMEAQHGLLIERVHAIYSFSHLTLHEYFTARYIVEHPSAATFQSTIIHAHDTRWRETLLLTTSMLDDVNGAIFFATFEQVLGGIIQTDVKLHSLFQWLSQTAMPGISISSRDIRVWYVLRSLIHIAGATLLTITITQDIVIDRDAVHPSMFASDRIRTLAISIAREPSFNTIFTITADAVQRFANALITGRENATLLATTLNDLFARAGMLAAICVDMQQQPQLWGFYTERRWLGIQLWVQTMANTASFDANRIGYEDILNTWNQQFAVTTPEMRSALATLSFPPKDATTNQWTEFSMHLQEALLNHLNIGYIWQLDASELRHLANYLGGTVRMLECLDLAAVADRDAIRNRILLPPLSA